MSKTFPQETYFVPCLKTAYSLVLDTHGCHVNLVSKFLKRAPLDNIQEVFDDEIELYFSLKLFKFHLFLIFYSSNLML